MPDECFVALELATQGDDLCRRIVIGYHKEYALSRDEDDFHKRTHSFIYENIVTYSHSGHIRFDFSSGASVPKDSLVFLKEKE